MSTSSFKLLRRSHLARVIGLALAIVFVGASGCDDSPIPPPPTPTAPTDPLPPLEPSGRNCVTLLDEFVGRDALDYPTWDVRFRNDCDFDVLVQSKAHLYDATRQFLWAIQSESKVYGPREVNWLCSPSTAIQLGGCGFYRLDSFETFFTFELFYVAWTATACNQRRVGDCIDAPLPTP